MTYFPAVSQIWCNECGGDIAFGDTISRNGQGHAHKKCLVQGNVTKFDGTTLAEMGF